MKNLFLFLLLMISCGCQKDPSNETRLLLDWMPNPNHVPLYVGLKKGFFDEQDIHLSIQKPCEAGGGLPYLIEKKTDVLLSYLPETIYNCSKGVNIKIIGTLFKQPLNAFIFLEETGIHSLDDLNHKKLGYCIDNTPLILESMLKQNRIEIEEKYPVQFDLLTTLAQKEVDVIYGAYWNIEPSQLETLGFKTAFLPFSKLGLPSYYELVFLMRGDDSPVSLDFVKHFQRALQKSIDFCKEFPNESLDIYFSCHLDFTEKTKRWSRVAWEKTYPILANDQDIEKSVLDTYSAWLIEQQIISPFSTEALLISETASLH